MADKKSIIDDIRKNYGNMLNLTEATNALGFSDKRAALNFLDGIPYCEMGRQKKFMASDIGKRIYDRMVDSI